MILQASNIKIEKSDNFKCSKAKIVPNAQIMKLLRDGIYTNKILATIREPLMNAIDSHVAAGWPERPVQVTLPNVYEPTLKIKDFGIGLDDYGVREIMFSYGDPTDENIKSKSNDFLGAMHIGAKAPNCYTNSFIVTAVKDSIRRIYNIFINENEETEIVQLDESATEEANGVEVSIPVKIDDINRFISEYCELIRFLPVSPITMGNDAFAPIENEWILKGNSWGLLGISSKIWDSKGSYVVMGGIPYKLDSKHLTLSSRQQNIANCGVVIFCNIGDVSIASSREEISYSPQSIEFLGNKFTVIEDEILTLIKSAVAKVNSVFEAKQLYYQYFSRHGTMAGTILDILGEDYPIVYNGEEITDWRFLVSGESDFVYAYSLGSRWDEWAGSSYRDYKIDIFDAHIEKQKRKFGLDNLYYYVEDEGTPFSIYKIRTVCRYLTKESHGEPRDNYWVYVVKFAKNGDFKKWLAENEIPEGTFTNIRAIVIPKKPRKPRTSARKMLNNDAPKTNQIAKLFNGKTWEWAVIDKDTEGYYLTRDRTDICLEKPLPLGINFKFLYDFVNRNKNLNLKIYSLPAGYITKNIKKFKLKSFDKFLANEFRKYMRALAKTKLSLGEIENDYGLERESKKLAKWVCSAKIKYPESHMINTLLKDVTTKSYDNLMKWKRVNAYFNDPNFKIPVVTAEIRDGLNLQIKKHSILNITTNLNGWEKEVIKYIQLELDAGMH